MKQKELDANEIETIIPASYIHTEPEEGSFSDEDKIHFPYCRKCNAHAFVETSVERGYSDSEYVPCPVCGGDFIRQTRIDSHFKSTDAPGILGWLEEKPNDTKILRLVFSQFVSETKKVAIQNHIESHDFSNYYEQLEVCEIAKSFPVGSKQSRNKLFSVFSSQKLLKLTKPEIKLVELPTPDDGYATVHSSDLKNTNPRLSPSYLEKLRKEWNVLQNKALKCSKNTRKKTTKKSSSPTANTKKGLKRSPKLRAVPESEKELSVPLLMRMRVARANHSGTRSTKRKQKKTGRIGSRTKKKLAS